MQTPGEDEDKGKGISSSSRNVEFSEESAIRDVFRDGNGDIMDFPGSGTAASALNFMQSVRAAAGETIDVEQTVQVNGRFSFPNQALHSQTGCNPRESSFNHGGSELNSLCGAVNNSLILELMNNPYAFPYVPQENTSFLSATRPHLRRNADDFGNAYNSENFPPHKGSLYPVTTCSFSDDSASQSSFLPEAAFRQCPLCPVIGRQSYMNFNMAQIPSKAMSILSTSNDLRLSGSSGTQFTTRKRKGHNAVHHPERHNLENLGISENDKEIRRGLVMILQKELRNSDVGSLGRIVLPKRDAEANLPPLHGPNGVILTMEDMISSVLWEFKFRYWPNNKSRMYVMENTGGFVKEHKLQTGDLFVVYKEECSGKYMVVGRKVCAPSNDSYQVEQICTDRGNVVEGGSTQQPRSNRETEINHLPFLEQSTTAPTINLLMPNGEVSTTSINVDGVSGGSTPSTQDLSEFQSFLVLPDC